MSIPAPLPGLYQAVPFDDYASWDAINIGSLVDMAEAPALFRWRRDHPRGDTAAMRMGRAYHTLLLEGEEAFFAEFAVGPRVSKRTKEWREFSLENMDRCPLTADEGDELFAMRDSLLERHNPRAFLSGPGVPEVSMVWSQDGVDCKGRIDRVVTTDNGPVILELKTVAKGGMTAPEWMRDVAKWRYHVRAAWYMEGYRLLTGTAPVGFYFLVVQRTAPYLSALYALEPGALELGLREAMALLESYQTCETEGEWEDPSRRIIPTGPMPRWYTPVLDVLP